MDTSPYYLGPYYTKPICKVWFIIPEWLNRKPPLCPIIALFYCFGSNKRSPSIAGHCVSSSFRAAVGISFEFKRQKIDGMTVKTLQTPPKSRRYGLTGRKRGIRVGRSVTSGHSSSPPFRLCWNLQNSADKSTLQQTYVRCNIESRLVAASLLINQWPIKHVKTY